MAALLAVVAVTLAGGGGARASGVPEGQPATVVPPPPAAAQDRVGVYHWGSDTAAWPGEPDRLTWGADAVARLGARTIRVALMTRDDYGVNNAAGSLVAIAEQPAYAGLFADARFSTYLLTTYSAADLAGDWSDGYTVAERQSARAELSALGRHLLSRYASKTFVILNWEGDNAMSPFPSADVTAWDGFVSWVDTRAEAVVGARASVPSSSSRIYSGLEFNAVKRQDSGAPCDTGGNKCVISYVAPRVGVDYYSYSAWQSLSVDTPTANVGARLRADLTIAYSFVAAARTGTTRAHFLLGELGAARDITGECDAASRIHEAIQATRSWGAAYGILWQAHDNAPASGIWNGLGAYRRDGSLALAGQDLRYGNGLGPLPVRPPVCAAINPGGVVDGRTFTSRIHRGQVISIFGAGFSASGNTVRLKQGSTFYTVRAGSPWWYESARQINLTLPAAVVAGTNVKVDVVAPIGLESNGQLIDVLP